MADDKPTDETTPDAAAADEAAPAAEGDAAPAAAAEASEPAAEQVEAPAAEADTDAETVEVDPEVAAREAEAEQALAQILEQAVEGDREAVAKLDDEDLRRIAREKAAAPLASLRYTSTGRRKRSVARVILTPGDGTFTLNGRTLEEYFPRFRDRELILEPLRMIDAEKSYNVTARLHGGGMTGQAGALRHGLSRALGEIHPTVRRQLKKRGLMKLDTRQVERKKAGLKKARKRPQFSKR